MRNPPTRHQDPTRRLAARLAGTSHACLGISLGSTAAAVAIFAVDHSTRSTAAGFILGLGLVAAVVAVYTLVRWLDVTGRPPFRTGVVVATLVGPPADGPAAATPTATFDTVKVG